MTKYVVVVGGSISGIGKGICSASIGKILQSYGFKVTSVKMDPYFNVDPGTMRPTEHGECWVTYDGGETDQDLGTYERFLNLNLSSKNNITSGQVFKTVIDRERAGGYLGKTVQFIPHIPNEIKDRIKVSSKGSDICIIEIGGTVGDYENIPFLFAVKSLERELRGGVVYVLVSYLPIPSHLGEMKTKPTQQAIKMLNEMGILPDFVVCRGAQELDNIRLKKIENYANLLDGHVISAPDVDTIYTIPLEFEKQGLGKKILEELGLKARTKPNWSAWEKSIAYIRRPAKEINVAIIGKYVDVGNFVLEDSYLSVKEALIHAGAKLNVGVKITWIPAQRLEKGKRVPLEKFDGIIIPGGFGSSGVEGKINAINVARVRKIPFLGLCYGLQLAVVEFARHVCKMKNAHTTEVDQKTKYGVIDILDSQKELVESGKLGGTMRLGEYAAKIDEGSTTFELYKKTGRLKSDQNRLEILKKNKKEFRLGILTGDNIILEKHRHRYEVNPSFINKIAGKGMQFSGIHKRHDGTHLVEFIELKNHPFFLATQGHPELKSSLEHPAPLFYGFVKACLKKNRKQD